MKSIIITLFLLFISLNSFSQKKFSTELLSGAGFNKDLSLINQRIENFSVYTTQINANYKFKLYKTIFAETGIGLQWFFSYGSVALSNFRATSLRLNLPFIISYSIAEKICIGSGAAIINNRDFDNLDFRSNHNLRIALILKSSYALKKDFDLVFIIKQNVSNIPNPYLINQPNTDVSLGISYKLF